MVSAKICCMAFLLLAVTCLVGNTFARPTRDMEFGDAVNLHSEDVPSTTQAAAIEPQNFPSSEIDTTTVAPTATFEQLADALKDAIAKAHIPEPSKRPFQNTNSVTDEEGNSVVVAGTEKPFDEKNFNDMLLNVVLEAVRKQVQNPDGSFDFMTILKQLFDVWAIRFDHNKDGEVSIAEFAQWLIEFVKTKIESF